jgi:hypothetical protein
MFSKILVANRGEIAIRAFRAGYELGAKTVAVFPHEDRNTGFAGRLKGGDLVAGQFQDLSGRAHEGDAGFGCGPCQAGVLREETVAGVDGVGAGLLGHAHHLLDLQVVTDRSPNEY